MIHTDSQTPATDAAQPEDPDRLERKTLNQLTRIANAAEDLRSVSVMLLAEMTDFLRWHRENTPVRKT